VPVLLMSLGDAQSWVLSLLAVSVESAGLVQLLQQGTDISNAMFWVIVVRVVGQRRHRERSSTLNI
jgi:hypothetical protein